MPAFLGLVPRWAWIALGGLLLVVAILFALDQYGDRRFSEGRQAEAAAWKEAEAKLLKKAGEASVKADKAAAARAAEYAATVEEEREQIADAVENGSSPLDVLFGG